VAKITGLTCSTINRGKADLEQPLPQGRVRRAGGGGRRSVCENDPGLVPAPKLLVEPATLGDPRRPLIWVSKSMEKLAATLTEMGHPISVDTVRTELVTVQSIRCWRERMGRQRYPNAQELTITADCGGLQWGAGAALESRTAKARR
jgi:hypothetical protein